MSLLIGPIFVPGAVNDFPLSRGLLNRLGSYCVSETVTFVLNCCQQGESLFDISHVELSAHRSSPQRQSPRTGTRIGRN